MEQLGADMSAHRSRSRDGLAGFEFAPVVTWCEEARPACCCSPGRRLLHHDLGQASIEGSEADLMTSSAAVRDQMRVWLEKRFGG